MPGKLARKKPSSRSAATANSAADATSSASTTVGLIPAKTTCVVCCQSLHPGKDEALFCDGRCQQWLHRYCCSVSVEAYKSIQADGSRFFCYDCYRRNKDEQLSLLERTVLELKAEISLLKSSWVGAVDSPQPAEKTYASTTAANSESIHRESRTTTMFRADHADRKYNIILYGVDKCPPGSSRASRLESDLSNAASVLSSVENTIRSQSVKDCYRLGKFSSSSTHPRPILIKMIRASDVAKVMSKKHLLTRPHFLKQDMSREHRAVEAVLLKERWKLIQSGVPRNHIRFKNSQLFVNGNLLGQVKNSKFHPVEGSSTQQSEFQQGSPRQTTPIVQLDNQSDQHVQNTSVSDKSTSPVSYLCQQSTSPCSADINTAPVSPSPTTSGTPDVPPDMDSSQS